MPCNYCARSEKLGVVLFLLGFSSSCVREAVRVVFAVFLPSHCSAVSFDVVAVVVHLQITTVVHFAVHVLIVISSVFVYINNTYKHFNSKLSIQQCAHCT